MKFLSFLIIIVFLGCSSGEERPQVPFIPDFPLEVDLSEYTMDSLHRYGAGDCYGTIRHYSGPETIVVDSLICSEYTFRFVWYWTDSEGKVSKAQETTWQSVLNSTWDDYAHIYAESVHMKTEGDSMVTFSRVDTLESHYLLLGPYPKPIDKEFEPSKTYNLDSVLMVTWQRK